MILDRDRGAPASKSLREYGQLQRTIMLINLLTGTTIWAAARLLHTELASDADYGTFINAVKAEWWAVPLTMGATIHIVGQIVNGDRRLAQWSTPAWRLLGAALCTMVMATFAFGCVYALSTGIEAKLFVLVHTMQSVAFTMLGAWFCGMAYTDLKAGLKNEWRGNGRIG